MLIWLVARVYLKNLICTIIKERKENNISYYFVCRQFSHSYSVIGIGDMNCELLGIGFGIQQPSFPRVCVSSWRSNEFRLPMYFNGI